MAGVGWMCQVRPFHLSASVRCWPELVSSKPNAVQAEGAGQATLARRMFWPPGGLGVGWMRQVWPSQRSAKVPVGLPGSARRPPTAVHADGEVHETAFRNHPPPGGFGVGTMRHVRPFHCSASVPGGLAMFGYRLDEKRHGDIRAALHAREQESQVGGALESLGGALEPTALSAGE